MKDLTVVSIPLYFGSMGLEYVWLKDRPEDEAAPPMIGFERRDTVASLTMGVASLIAPLVVPRLLRGVTPGKGRYAKVLVGGALAAAAVTTVADRIARLDQSDAVDQSDAEESPADDAKALQRRRRVSRAARKVASASSVAAIVAGGTAITTAWASRTSLNRMWRRRVLPDLGTGPAAHLAAILGWDFIYYWNHRLMHTSRCMWAIHVVHHSSERYNFSTALRQPVADAFGVFAPYSVLCLLGIQPRLISTARGVNLLYQYWIHTETVGKLGRAESTLNTPSHHRVHHGSNGRYLDRNHGSILIVWDRLFGTFEPESEQVVYGLTKNINTFNPVRIIIHEYVDMLRDVARSDNWTDRLSFVLRGPGWAGRRRRELAIQDATAVDAGGQQDGLRTVPLRTRSVQLGWRRRP
jgi:sterol desaturase/sphingolipid hydroxylase (fatty acid hydroxylase superfamily)